MALVVIRPHACLTDDELVVRFRGGDDGAFSEIHRRFRPGLTTIARRVLRDSEEDAEDIVQETFISAYRALRATDGVMALRPWLYTIVRHRAFDVLRTRRPADCYSDAVELRTVPETDPAGCFAVREELRLIVAEIGRLPERQRTALLMREFDGRTHAETARALHTTVSATKSLVVRARSSLQAVARAA